MSIEAVFLDLDGVALHDNQIVPGAVEAISYIQEQGVPVMPVTGRDFKRSLWLTEPLGFKEYGVFNGGAEIASFTSQQTIWERRMSRDSAREVADLLIPYSVRMHVGKGNKLLTESTPLADITGDSLGIWAEFPTAHLTEVEVILNVMQDKHNLQYHYNHGTVEPDITGVHVTRHRADKFHTTRLLMRWLGINPINAVAVGDGDSDIPLFNAVGRGIAMENATEKLKARAHHITHDVRQRGLEQAMLEYVLQS